VTNAPAHHLANASGDTTSVEVGTTRPLSVYVEDEYNNAVPDHYVRFNITSAPDVSASLASNGFVLTDANGRAIDSLTTAVIFGDNVVDAEILDGSPPAQEKHTFTVTTVAGGIDRYEVITDLATQTAGQPVNVTVRALDTNNNLVVQDSTTPIVLSLSEGTGWGPVFATLAAGTTQTALVDTVAGDLRVYAETNGAPSVWGESGLVTITPDVPFGSFSITVTANPDTITATELTTSPVTAGEFLDQYGNRVAAGEMVTVFVTTGTIDNPDQAPGTPLTNEQPVDANGEVKFQVRSPITPGDATLGVASVNGNATGTGTIHFAQPVAFAASNAPDPNSVIVGQSERFHVVVQNTSSTGAELSTSTAFHFTDGPTQFEAFLIADEIIAAGDTATLVFENTTVDPAMTPGPYQPHVRFVGLDEHGSPFAFESELPAQSLLVSAIRITDITVPEQLSVGQTDTIRVTIQNPSQAVADVTSVTLTFTPTGNFVPLSSPDMGLMIPGNLGVRTYRVPVLVDIGTSPGDYSVDAQVEADVGGNTVIDDSIDPLPQPTLTIQSAVVLSFVATSLTPKSVSQGQTHTFSAEIDNDGEATVTFDPVATTLSFTDGTTNYVTNLVQSVAIPGKSTQTVVFNAAQIPAGMRDSTTYDVSISIAGDENGSPFADTLQTAPADYVTVQTPAAIAEAPDALDPNRVSTKSSLRFTVNVINSGTANVELTPATTTISFATYAASLDPNETTVITPGPNTLTFVAEIVDQAIVPATYFPTVDLNGSENGINFVDSIVLTDSIVVEVAPDINIVSIETSQPRITSGRAYTIDVWMLVQNSGGATVEFTNASIGLELGGVDRTGEYSIPPPSAFNGGVDLSGGGTIDTVTFAVETSASFTNGNMTITGDLEVRDLNTTLPVFADTDGGGKGSILVQSPAILSIESITPELDPVTRNMTVPFDFAVDMVVRNLGGSDIKLALNGLSTTLSFDQPGWLTDVRPTLSNGDSVLSAGEAGTVVFDINQVGSQTGVNQIGADIGSFELNSGFPVDGTTGGPGFASITVQDSARIVISNMQPSRATLTNGSDVSWELTMDVTNAGEADVDLSLGAAIVLTFEDVVAQPSLTKPATLEGGGIRLLGGQTDQLVIPVDETGLFNLIGSLDKTIDITILGFEPSTGIPHVGTANTIVTVQEVPTISYTAGDLQPDTVSSGAVVSFQLPITNPDPDAATIELDRAQTVLSFAGGFYSVFLQPSSPGTIPGGPVPTTLVFESAEINPSVPLGAQTDVTADLYWTENGRADFATINIPSTDLFVQDAPDLNIVSIIPDRSEVTVGQAPWNIRMVLENQPGAAPVGLHLSTSDTWLSFKTLVGDLVVTPEYDIIRPTGLQMAGDSVLAGGETDTLVFTVNATGTTTGTIIVSGEVAGTDLNSSDPVFDNTVDGGDGSFELQADAALQIVSITPSQPTATINQIGQYQIKMAVLNNGGSAVDLALDPTTYLSFSGSAGWSSAIVDTLVGGGYRLDGGEVDTVTFVVSQSGDTAGPTTIGGEVAGTVVNTLAPISDNTGDGGTGTIELQTQALIAITGVTPSRLTVTDGSPVTWNIAVDLVNSGESDARLELPASLTVGVTGGAVGYDPVDEIDEGGLVLSGNGGTGTLTIHVTSTGPFSAWGTGNVNIDLDALELNSGRSFSAPTGQGSITVQKPPNLTVDGLNPVVVSSGAVVGFLVDVSNADPDAATAVLNRAQTRLHFDGGNYSAFLDLASDDAIAGGDVAKTIRFEAKLIGPAIAPNTYDVNVDLVWVENDNPGSGGDILTNGLTVQAAPVLSITQLVADRTIVTAGQREQWIVTMNVSNGGGAALELDLDSLKTDISFELPEGGNDATYILGRPDSLVAGGITLMGGESGELQYTVIRTGDSTGVIEIAGKVEGVDPFTTDVFTDDTFDGGGTTVTVQSPAILDILTSISISTAVASGSGPTRRTGRFSRRDSPAAILTFPAERSTACCSRSRPRARREPGASTVTSREVRSIAPTSDQIRPTRQGSDRSKSRIRRKYG
jgi:hypothetical protein